MRIAVIMLSLNLLVGNSLAAEELADALKKPILPEGKAEQQHTDFVSKRIPQLNPAESAAAWQQQAQELREKILQEVVYKGVPQSWYQGQPQVEWLETIQTGQGYSIKKLRYEALPGLWIPALLYEPDNLTGKVPAVLNVNGHDSDGKSATYKQLRCINLAKRGILALNTEWLRMGELRGSAYSHDDLAALDLCGVSGLSVFYLAMSRGLDVLTAHEHADPERIAMTGLSGGGWQTIILSSLDTRIKVSIPVAGYSSLRQRVANRDSIGDLEQNPTDLVSIADYVHLTALLTPRPALLIYNVTDNCCFKSATVRPSTYEPVVPFYAQAGAEKAFEFYENSDPGTHNYELDNRQQMYRFLTNHWLNGAGSAVEIPSDAEIKTAEELKVGVPQHNATFRSLAEEIAQKLPIELNEELPQMHNRLKETLRWEDKNVQAERSGEQETAGDLTIDRYILTDGEWNFPGVVVTPEEYTQTVFFVADTGFAGQADKIAKLAAEGQRVICIDPAFIGEANPPGTLYQNVQLAATVGARPLGIQASQILGTIRLASGYFSLSDAKLQTIGPRSSLAALCAAAVDGKQLIAEVETQDLPETLKAYFREGRKYDRTPEIYCFGLLEHFDIPQLRKLHVLNK